LQGSTEQQPANSIVEVLHVYHCVPLPDGQLCSSLSTMSKSRRCILRIDQGNAEHNFDYERVNLDKGVWGKAMMHMRRNIELTSTLREHGTTSEYDLMAFLKANRRDLSLAACGTEFTTSPHRPQPLGSSNRMEPAAHVFCRVYLWITVNVCIFSRRCSLRPQLCVQDEGMGFAGRGRMVEELLGAAKNSSRPRLD
jgi:hypothetical protein